MPINISGLTSEEAVYAAIERADQLGREQFLANYGFSRSRKYPLYLDGKVYDSKAIAGVAYGLQHSVNVTSRDFSGGEATVVRALRKLGFHAAEATHPALALKFGATYQRRYLLELYGGQMQAGIWTPAEFSVVMLFTGESGHEYGYKDGWTEEGVFRFTGEGQLGDMRFERGNLAIHNHRESGRDLLLFTDLGKGKGVRYEGLFECAEHDVVDGVDRAGAARKVIVFDLVPVKSFALDAKEDDEITPPSGKSLDELREAAMSAARASPRKGTSTSTMSSWWARSATVKEYVLARADGKCESCLKPAPFVRKGGHPYLEPHHTKRLADDGPDDPRWVGAVCPNCHREIHSGIDGAQLNLKLQERVRNRESELDSDALK